MLVRLHQHNIAYTADGIDVSRFNYKYLQESRSIADKPTRFFRKSRAGWRG